MKLALYVLTLAFWGISLQIGTIQESIGTLGSSPYADLTKIFWVCLFVSVGLTIGAYTEIRRSLTQ